ncbi:hypothetical protein BS47DRAFT_1101901 [Hydnum rufescens UP504]|uniref:Uncharacterized protein n=1 Tax=Hydnum rufescens UP504 TaxID=1448309 RepID=A0A9P6AWQ5_9AGAM|nr:hypothetical protein BS47DRAFT_1101901 [Hydnum rufescens UP504]
MIHLGREVPERNVHHRPRASAIILDVVSQVWGALPTLKSASEPWRTCGHSCECRYTLRRLGPWDIHQLFDPGRAIRFGGRKTTMRRGNCCGRCCT